MIFETSQTKYPTKHVFGGLVLGGVFFSPRRWAGGAFCALGGVFGHFAESNCFLTSSFSHERVCKKGSNTPPKDQMPHQTHVYFGGL